MIFRLAHRSKKWLLSAAALAFVLPAAPLRAEMSEQRLKNAADSFREIMEVPEKGIPRELLDRAECLVIIPGLKKGAFLIGGKYGKGFATCRRRAEGWGPPAGVRIEGGSYGFQIGGSSTDVFMLIMNENGMRHLMSDKFTIGGEAAAAAGPVGRNSSANTDVLLRAEILSWSRSRGLFAGLSLEGATMRPDTDANDELYGRELSNQEILDGGVTAPKAAQILISVLNQYTGNVSAKNDTAAQAAPLTISEALRQKGRATLGAVHFETGLSNLTEDSEAELADLQKILEVNPAWNIRVEGYTDNQGDSEANRKLSEDRATAVLNWLTNHGIDRSRLSSRGYGGAFPVTSNSTDEGREKNRRVEVVRI